MLNELDNELTQRGLKYCRYADDCNIYFRSKKSAERVMGSIRCEKGRAVKLPVGFVYSPY